MVVDGARQAWAFARYYESTTKATDTAQGILLHTLRIPSYNLTHARTYPIASFEANAFFYLDIVYLGIGTVLSRNYFL